MGWVLEIFIGTVAQLFGQAVGHERPWWLGFLASIGVLAALAAPMLLLLVLLR
jgi:hypothetical protein